MSHILWDFVRVEIEYDLKQYVHVCKSYLAFIMFIAYRLMGGSSQTAQLQKLKGTSIVFIVELADLIYKLLSKPVGQTAQIQIRLYMCTV